MRGSRFLIQVVLAACAWGASVAATAQEWRLEPRAGEDAKGSPQFNWAALSRWIRVSETAPGVFSVMELTPFGGPSSGGNFCLTRPRKGRLAMTGERQVLTIAPSLPGCPELRLIVERDGSGWEEQGDAGQWVKTGALLLGRQQVHSSTPVPAMPSASPPPVTAVAMAAPAADSEPQRESPALAKTGHRRALVIGNDSYRHTTRLLNARSDARAMGLALERAGFDVITRLDVDGRTLRASLREFKASLEGGDEVIVFYSGHGVQIGGINYLLPVDIQGESEDQLRDDAVPLQRVLDDVSERHARFALAVIDACRDNPFQGGGYGRSLGSARGLAPTTAATGQMIIYSAGTGQRALDRLSSADKNPNGVFTRVFLKEMETPGVSIDRVLRNVRNEVVRMARAVGHEQTPALYDQTVGDFYLRPTH